MAVTRVDACDGRYTLYRARKRVAVLRSWQRQSGGVGLCYGNCGPADARS